MLKVNFNNILSWRSVLLVKNYRSSVSNGQIFLHSVVSESPYNV